MRCRLCDGSVEWQGPLTDLRGTKCLSCGETNCQEVEPPPPESDCYGVLGPLAIDAVLAERVRQDEKWGEQNHDPFTWLTILGEEYGEASKATLEARFGGKDVAEIRAEMVQCAAVALAFVECLDRNKWQWA